MGKLLRKNLGTKVHRSHFYGILKVLNATKKQKKASLYDKHSYHSTGTRFKPLFSILEEELSPMKKLQERLVTTVLDFVRVEEFLPYYRGLVGAPECDIGTKIDSKGYKMNWKGYKLHIDTADGDIPISAILTSASTHESQVAIPDHKQARDELL